MSEPKPATQKIRIVLGALTRVEYTEVLEVPAGMSRSDLNRLVEERYDRVDGGDFVDDDQYWERGECYWEPEGSKVEASAAVKIGPEGGFVLIPKPTKEA